LAVCLVTHSIRDGATALHLAADADLVEIATILLDSGVNVNDKAS
jgi:hypothetical protein